MMLDHFNLPVSDLSVSGQFYETVLSTLGFGLLVRDGDAIGFGRESWEFGLFQEKAQCVQLHVAFKASTPDAVRVFYRAALESGARDNGEPGYRSHYGPAYYAAFVYDPDGHNIEAVCRGG